MVIKHILAGAFALAVAASLNGCATAYQSKSFTGGFSETMLAPDTFKIGFSGNGFTSSERASDFAMLRAADKSLMLGCNYFGVMNEAEGGSTGSFTVGSASYGRGSAFATSSTFPVFKPNSSLLVKCFQAEQPGINLFDAHFIANSIRTKYGMSQTNSSTPSQIGSANSPQHGDPNSMLITSPQSPPPQNIARQVLAAQNVSLGQGCGDVSATGSGMYQATCTAGTLVVECEGAACRPIQMKSK
jgi:hypothetical protein